MQKGQGPRGWISSVGVDRILKKFGKVGVWAFPYNLTVRQVVVYSDEQTSGSLRGERWLVMVV